MQTRYNKIIRDIRGDYSKNFMLILAIAVGVFGIGTILGSYSVIKREMTDNYMNTTPASATIEVSGELSSEIVDRIRQQPGIKEAERHATLIARMKVGEKWYPLLLFVVDDFKTKQTNRPRHISGESEPYTGSMLVERTAYVMMQAKEGESITVKTQNGQPKKIMLAGTVHDPGLAPAWQEQAGYGYITYSTLQLLGETQGFDQLRILVRDGQLSTDHIIQEATQAARELTRSGYDVHEIQVPPPGKHPHQGQMSAVMSIFVVFSFLLLILSSILVGTSIATLMVKQVRQIGVMKTVGGRSSQIAVLYLVMILILCIAAIVIAIPLSWVAAAEFFNRIAELLNLEISDHSIPAWVGLIQIGSGILIPLAAAAIPIIRGSRITVKDALDNHGVSGRNIAPNPWAVRISQHPLFNEILRLSLRNVFRQRSRLLMTLGLLAAGGAMFMTALNVSKAWDENLNQLYTQRRYDLEVRLTVPTDATEVLDKIKRIQGVTDAEGWSYAATSAGNESDFEITRTYPDKGHGSFNMQALPVPTRLLTPKVVEGKWLDDPHANQVVLNQGSRSSYKVGDRISLSVEGKASQWTVIGFTEDVGSPALAYVSLDMFSKLMPSTGKIKMLRIAYADRSRQNAVDKNRQVEQLLEKENIAIASTTPVWQLHNAIAAHMKVLVNSLIGMAILMAIVGTLGLMSSMTMNVLERTREIGVMRAVGATPSKIRKLVAFEGLFIGGLSLFAAVAVSLLLSTYLGRLIGSMAFRTPLSLNISFVAWGSWALIVIIGAYLATLYPAHRANHITTREALAYE